MRRILALIAVVALAGCAKHDKKAADEREWTIMMEKLLEAAELTEADGGTAATESGDR
jgi:hypothetical protein